MKKLFILFNIFLFIFCLIVPVSADEESVKLEPDISENKDDSEQKEYVEKSEYDKDINVLKEEIKEVENLAKSAGLGPKKTNYNDLSFLQIKYLYDNYSDYTLAVLFNQNSQNSGYIPVLYCYNYYNNGYTIDLNNAYYFDFTIYSTKKILPNGQVVNEDYSNNPLSYRIYKTQSTDGNVQGVYISKVDWEYYLRPYHLHIINNGLGELTTEIPSNYGGISSSDWYLYSGQEVDITYGDDGDFTGWYDINGNLISNDENYIFNINQDTTLVVNYYPNPQTFDYTNLLYIIIGLLAFILFNDLTKGVLN